MTQKQALISIILFLAVVIGGLFAFYYIQFANKPASNIPDTTTLNPVRPPVRLGQQNNGNNSNNAQNATSTEQDTNTNPNSEGEDIGDATLDIAPRLRRVIDNPVAGSIIFASTTKNKKGVVTSSETLVRLTDATNGKVYETRIGSSSVTWLGTIRVPAGKVEETVWTKKGDAFYMRYANSNENIETVYATLIKRKLASTTTVGDGADVTFAPYDIKTAFLPKDILQLATFDATQPLFYTLKQGTGVIGVLADAENKKPKTIFSSPTSEWLVSWPNNIHLTTKPSGTFIGTHFFLDPKTGALSRISSDIFGLTALSNPKGDTFVISGNENNSLGTGLFSTKNGTLAAFPIITMAEKCVWGIKNPTTVYCAVPNIVPSGIYPDVWYQGTVSFNDTLVRINTITNDTQTILTPEKHSPAFIADMINLQIDKADQFISFRNKRDNTFWILRIER